MNKQNDDLTWWPRYFAMLKSLNGFSNKPMVNLTRKILLTASLIRLIGMTLLFTRDVNPSMNSK